MSFNHDSISNHNSTKVIMVLHWCIYTLLILFNFTEVNNIHDNHNKNIRGLNTRQNVQMGFMMEFHEGISEGFYIEWEMGSSLGLKCKSSLQTGCLHSSYTIEYASVGLLASDSSANPVFRRDAFIHHNIIQLNMHQWDSLASDSSANPVFRQDAFIYHTIIIEYASVGLSR